MVAKYAHHASINQIEMDQAINIRDAVKSNDGNASTDHGYARGCGRKVELGNGTLL